MSQSNSQSRPQRNEAVRVFSTEFNEAKIEFQKPEESDNDRAPKYGLLPTGAPANRVLMVGTCMEITQVSNSPVSLRARILDETGEFYVYAGQYNPEALNILQNLKPEGDKTELKPENLEHVMVVGKPNTYTTDKGVTYVSVNPENIFIIDNETRQRWVGEAVEQTLDRLEAFDNGEADYRNEAQQHYDFDLEILRNDVRDVVAELEPTQSNASEAVAAGN